MQTYILNSSGRQSIAIVGEELASMGNRDTDEEHKVEWDSLRIFKLDPEWKAKQEAKTRKKLDTYWVGIAKCTLWPNEHNRYRILYAKTIPEVLGIVRTNLPIFYQSIEDQLGVKSTPQSDYEPGRSPVVS